MWNMLPLLFTKTFFVKKIGNIRKKHDNFNYKL